MNKEIVVIELDFIQGPIMISDVNTGEPYTGIDVIDNNKEIWKINHEISDMYSSYYELDSHGLPCWFNYEKEKREKYIMLEKMNSLIKKLNEINDGSFVIEDRETNRIKNL